ncbi:SDR family oxidoreductase [Mangrovicoccus algicola]|uniref:SDR family oxidoreductase n=1 Tax=Mangrovicoccus algicola TaxID=2771008 RepID=A0A8J6YUL4_9RHOB|nr:SDR family oxidoreductase [Mangrovicoccus algicola]MBE3638057.1 SDR family oxidoreductase [Mangrovicoccus algicola]
MGIALITGAGKRLGRAMALSLAEQGHDIAVHYASSATEAESLCAELRAMGREARAFRADLTVEADIQGLVPAVRAAFGRPLTVLVNNASIFEYDSIASATRDSWDRHFESNLRAPFVLIQAFAAQVPDPVTDAAGEPVAQGVVVNMIDQRVRKLTPEFTTYTLAKAALWTLTQTAAQGLAPRVRVNAIGPGPTMQGARQSAEHFAAQRAATVLERGADPGDICAALRYLVEARSVTGQLICTDGGQHLAWRTPDVLGVE